MNPSNLDAGTLKIIVYFGVFIFTSLVGIIVWLAKRLDSRVEESVQEIIKLRMEVSRQGTIIDSNKELAKDNKVILDSHEKGLQEMRLQIVRYFRSSFNEEKGK